MGLWKTFGSAWVRWIGLSPLGTTWLPKCLIAHEFARIWKGDTEMKWLWLVILPYCTIQNACSLLLDYSRSCIWHIQDLVSDVYIWLFCVSSCNHVYEYIFCIYVFQNALLPFLQKGPGSLIRKIAKKGGWSSSVSTQILIGRTSYVPHFLLESWSS